MKHYPISRFLGLVSVIALLSQTSLLAQCMSGGSVTGQTSICVGSTYSYYADYTSYCTWGCTSTVSYNFSVTGGTVVLQGSENIRVTWNSFVGQVNLTVTDVVCWPDILDQYGNPVCYNECYTASLPVSQELTEAYVSASPSSSVCDGETITLSTITGTGYTYQWLKEGINVSGATAYNYAVSTGTGSPENYSVRVTKNGCTVTSYPIQLTFRQKPPVPQLSSATIDLIPGAILLETSNGVSPQHH